MYFFKNEARGISTEGINEYLSERETKHSEHWNSDLFKAFLMLWNESIILYWFQYYIQLQSKDSFFL